MFKVHQCLLHNLPQIIKKFLVSDKEILKRTLRRNGQVSEVAVTHIELFSGMFLLVMSSGNGGCPVCKLSSRIINSPVGLRLSFKEEGKEFEEL